MLLEALVESGCDGVVLPRNEKVVGSIPTGGSTSGQSAGPDGLSGRKAFLTRDAATPDGATVALELGERLSGRHA